MPELGRGQAARELLLPVYNRFTEGFGTSNLQAVRALLGRRQSKATRLPLPDRPMDIC